jgi:hypothetical protein
VGLLAVFPLALLLFTGLYLFVLPYATKWGIGRRTDRTGVRAARRWTRGWPSLSRQSRFV